MSALKRLITRLRRTGSGRGFGIQSPTDYAFVCNVVNERLPYYAYDDLRKEVHGLSARDRRKAELAFRVANFVQPAMTVSIGLPKWWTIYAARGCRKSTTAHRIEGSGKMLAMIRCGAASDADMAAIMDHMATSGKCLIADGINDNQDARRQWEAIAGDERSTLVFDLYDIGIVIADGKRTKTTYKINY